MKITAPYKKRTQLPNADTVQRSLVALRPPEPFDTKNTVQREVLEYNHTNDEHAKAALQYEKELDAAVDQSYKHVMTTPRLGEKPAAIDGHTKKWVEDWDDVMNNKGTNQLAASFGYAIESLTTGVYLPKPPGGYALALQGVRQTTRPDLILIQNGKDIAWLDITAKKSKGHIWDKEPSWRKSVPHASEILYPSLENQHIEFMKKNDGNKEAKGFDPDAFAEQLAMSKKLNEKRIAHWQQQGKWISMLWRVDSEKLRNLDKTKSNPKLYYQNPMLLVLCTAYGLKVPDGLIQYMQNVIVTDDAVDAFETDPAKSFRQEAGNILAALGLTPATYGFNGGGVNRGMAWLQQFDTKMPQLQDLFAPEKKNNDELNKSNVNTNSSDKMVLDDNKE